MLTKEEIIRTALPVLLQHGVTRAGLFGSHADGTATEHSDVDLLVELKPGSSLVELASLWLELQEKFRTKVDLVPYSSIKAMLKEPILAQEVRFHEA